MQKPILFWFRRDLRLADHPGLTAVAATGAPVIPIFVLDPETQALGSAVRWRLEQGLAAFAARLESLGSRLILRAGPALEVLRQLVSETGAGAVHWSRAYDPAAIARDTSVKAGLKANGTGAESHPGFLLHEPWTVETGQGGIYRVFTPFWKAVRQRDIGAPLAETKPAPAARLARLRRAGRSRAGPRHAARGCHRCASCAGRRRSGAGAAGSVSGHEGRDLCQ